MILVYRDDLLLPWIFCNSLWPQVRWYLPFILNSSANFVYCCCICSWNEMKWTALLSINPTACIWCSLISTQCKLYSSTIKFNIILHSPLSLLIILPFKQGKELWIPLLPHSTICCTDVASLFNLFGCLSCPLHLTLFENDFTYDGWSSAASAESTTTLAVPSME